MRASQRLTMNSAAETCERNAMRDRRIRGFLRPALQSFQQPRPSSHSFR